MPGPNIWKSISFLFEKRLSPSNCLSSMSLVRISGLTYSPSLSPLQSFLSSSPNLMSLLSSHLKFEGD
jgi:hypothetical protein